MKHKYYVNVIIVQLLCAICTLSLVAQPSVTSTSPAGNKLNVAANSGVTVTFGGTMNTTTLNTDNLIVSGSQSGRHTGAIVLHGNTSFTLNPDVAFKYGEIVSVSLTPGIKNAAGDSLVNGYHWNFTIVNLQSVGTFAPKTDYATGNAPWSVYVSDLDGDGDADVAVANENSNTLSVLKNNGDGTFGSKVDYATGSNPWSVVVSDVDGDGDGDLIVTNYSSNTVSIMKNNGDGTFASKIDYATGSFPRSVFVSDITGDGDGDIIVTNYGANTVSIFKNNGDGTFAAKVDYTTGSAPISVFVSDLDGDGDMDLAVANFSSNSVSILKNIGDGTFAAKVDYTVGSVPYAVFVGDIDGDGDGDLAVANNNENTVSTLKNNGDGTFSPKVNYTTGNNPYSLFISDIDGDGDGDILAANANSASISILKNNGAGLYAAKVDYPTGASPHSLFMSDVDGDGDADIAVTSSGIGALSILKNNDIGITTVATISPSRNQLNIAKNTGISATFNVAMKTSSWDGNSILVYGSQSGKHSGSITLNGNNGFTFNPNVYFKNGEIVSVTLTSKIKSAIGDSLINGYHWNFTVANLPTAGVLAPKVDYTTGDTSNAMFTGDLDGDGDIDIAVANGGLNIVSIIKNNGDGTFAAKIDYSTGSNPFSVMIRDVDGDGDGDLVIANANANTISVLKNNGNATFAGKVDYATGSSPRSVFLSDLDGDGDADVVVANEISNSVSILKNNGTGTFSTKADYTTGPHPSSVIISDVDGDGDGDLIVTNYSSNTVSVLKNNGDGTFVSKVDYATGNLPRGLFINDIDADGDGDIVLSNYGANTVSILKNNGDGTFVPKTDYATGSSPASVFVSDVDGDGDMDIAVADFSSNSVSLLKNNGDGSFASNIDYTTGTSPNSVFISDFDGDGDGDLAVINQASASISILKNNYKSNIIGKVFTDKNVNGVNDATETGIFHWKIRLSGSKNDSTFSDANGNYAFDSLSNGTYTIAEEPQNGWLLTLPVSGSYTVNAQGQNISDKDFGNYQFGSISGVKFYDRNGNGLKDAGEGGLADWKIKLSGQKIDSVLSDANGNYSFSNLLPGTYTVQEEHKPGWLQTIPAPSGTYFLLMTSGINFTGKNFGDFFPGGISGSVYNDFNGNGIRDTGETMVSTWKIILTGAKKDSVLTDLNGAYTFVNLPQGNYTIQEQASAGLFHTVPLSGTYFLQLDSGAVKENYNFGNFQLGSISGKVFYDIDSNGIQSSGEGGLPNWQIVVHGVIDTVLLSDATGNYQLGNLRQGSYTIQEPLKFGYVRSVPESSYSVIINSGTNITGLKFGNFLNGSLTVQMFEDADGDFATVFDRFPQRWHFRLYKNSVTPANLVAEVVDTVFQFSGNDGLYIVEQQDSLKWISLGKSKNGNPEPGAYYFDTLHLTAATSNQLEFINFHPNTLTIHNEEDIDGSFFFTEDDRVPKQWFIRLQAIEGSAIDTFIIDSVMHITNLPQGTYIVSVADSGEWTHLGILSPNSTFRSHQSTDTVVLHNGIDAKITFVQWKEKPDSVMYRTFTQQQLNAKSVKVKFTGKKPIYPTFGNIRDSIFDKAVLKGTVLLLGIQRRDSARVLGWVTYKGGKGNGEVFVKLLPMDSTAKAFKHKGELKNPAIKKINNALVGELIALRFNMFASDYAITSPESLSQKLGDLYYQDPADTGTKYYGKTLRELASLSDSALTLGTRIAGINYVKLASILKRVNEAFAKPGAFSLRDTVSFIKGGVKLQGYKMMKDISFLRRNVLIPLRPLCNAVAMETPSLVSLSQNYPNPFNPVTTIGYSLSSGSYVSLKVYNILGEEVATLLNNEMTEEGEHTVEFNASALPSGVYFYRLNVASNEGLFSMAKKLLLMK